MVESEIIDDLVEEQVEEPEIILDEEGEGQDEIYQEDEKMVEYGSEEQAH